MRRLFVLALGSALLLSACSTASVWPGASSGASGSAPVASTSAAAATSTPTAAATPTKAKATATPTELATEAPADVTADWITFAPAGSGFSVLLPGTPKLTTQTASTAVGKVPTSLWTYEESNDLAYFVALAKYPKGTISKQATSTVYTNALKGMIGSSTTMTISDSHAVTVGGRASEKFTITLTQGTIKGLLVAVGDNLYMVYVAWTTTEDGRPDMDAFISHFELTV